MGTVRAEEKGKDKNVLRTRFPRCWLPRKKPVDPRPVGPARSSQIDPEALPPEQAGAEGPCRSTNVAVDQRARGDRRRRQGPKKAPQKRLGSLFGKKKSTSTTTRLDVSAKSLPVVEALSTRY